MIRFTFLTILAALTAAPLHAEFQAGAAVIDITPPKLPVLVNGGMMSRYVDKIKTPILFIHGEKDDNPGTFPIQSQRMYQAVKGNGGDARLVMLPHESHGYRARQSVLHTQAEMVNWFNRFVRDAK
jgi:pimeloyl-ACP methyl ester carboxylesterase